jgi:PAS domain S-box-containing protein
MRQLTDSLFVGLLEAAPDATVCADSGGRIVLVNAQAERLFGYRREDLAGQPAEILVPDAMKAGHPALRAGYAADPQPRPMGAGKELSGRRRDAAPSPRKFPCRPSTPTRASWSRPPSVTSPIGSHFRPSTTG